MAIVSGVWLVLNPVPRVKADLVVWMFSPIQYDAISPLIPEFEALNGVSVNLQLVNYQAANQRLRSAIWAKANLPDIVTIETTSAGGFFRGPMAQSPFIDLNPYLERDGLKSRLPESRLSAYQDRGRQLGLPLDLHPVMMAYRADLLEPELAERGLTIEQLDTWDKWVEFGQAYTIPRQRYLMQLADDHNISFDILFSQRGGNYFNDDGELEMNSDAAAETLLFMIPLIAGNDSERIAVNIGSWGAAYFKGLMDGYYAAVLCPDWMSGRIELNAESLAGKMKLFPLPAFQESGKRTSQYGGTMLAITEASSRPDLAWELIKFLYLNDPSTSAEVYKQSNILSADYKSWEHPIFHQPDTFWSGQCVAENYIALVPQMPKKISHPFLPIAINKMREVIAACRSYYSNNGPIGFEAFVREELSNASDEVKKQMKREPDWDK